MMTIDPMTKCRQILLGYLIGTIIFGFAACTDEVGGKALSGSGSITFTVGGIAEGGAETLTRAQLEPQTLRQDLGDGLSMVYTLSIDPASLTRTSSNMATGTKYRVIAYKKNGSNYDYAKEKVFEAGTSGSLDGLETAVYKIAAYSYNTSTDPGKIENSPDGDSDDTKLTVEDTSQDLLHWASSSDIDLSSGSASPVSITFKHRFPTVTVRLSSSLTSDPFSDVNATAKLYGYKAVQTLYSDAVPAKGSSIQTQIFSLPTTAVNDTAFTSTNTRRVFTGSDGTVILQFTGTINVNTKKGDRTITNPIVTFTKLGGLIGGANYTIKMHVEASKGDYYDPEAGHDVDIPLGSAYTYNGKTTITFQTYNLGADPSLSPKEQMAYPYTDAKNIRVYGGLYQWGRNDRQHSLRDPFDDSDTEHFYEGQLSSYDPDTDHAFCYGKSAYIPSPYSWLSGDSYTSTFWGNNTASNNQTNPPSSAGTYNPCPSGYRVPTQYEWALIFNDNATSGTPGPNTVSNDQCYFNGSVGASSYGNTWVVPYSNQNVVWVRMQDRKAYGNSNFSSGHMSGLVVYAKSAVGDGSGSSSTYNAAFAIDTDLTDLSAPEPLMFLPTAGLRDWQNGDASDTTGSNVGYVGHYWSCTTFPSAYIRSVAATLLAGSVDLGQTSSYRAYGMSVRCVKI